MLVNHNKLKSMNVNKSKLCFILVVKKVCFLILPRWENYLKEKDICILFSTSVFMECKILIIWDWNIFEVWQNVLCHKMSAKATTGQIKIIWLCLEIKINVVFVMSLGQIVMNWLIDCSRILRVQFIHPIIISYISSKSLIWHLFTKCKLIFLSRCCF